MTKIDTSSPEHVLPTPSHTVGPFYGYALPFRGGEDIAPAGHPDTITVHGYVYDGAGAPLPDALLEVWGPGPDGELPTVDGSMRRDPASGGFLGRNGVEFTGFGRIQTDANGHWYARTLRPGARGTARRTSACACSRADCWCTCSPGSTCRVTRRRSPPTRCCPGWTPGAATR